MPLADASAADAVRVSHAAHRLPAPITHSRRFTPLMISLLVGDDGSLMEQHAPAARALLPDTGAARAPLPLQQRVGEQVHIARQLAAVEIGGLPLVLDRLAAARGECLEHVGA